MSKLIAFPGTSSEPKQTHAEAIPDGINVMEMNAEGVYQQVRMMGYSAAIRQLDNGTYDHDLPAGMRVVAAICEAERKGYYSPSDERRAIVWRWVVACLFILEQMDKNGTVDVVNEDGGTDGAVKYVGRHGGISIYPATERFSLANHIEGLALEKYGADAGLLLAVQMYQGMTEAVPGEGLKLSQMGREGLEMLHDGFIEMLNTEGMPAEPTAH